MDITMPSIMGGVSLAGIVVNESILLVVFTKNGIMAGRTIASQMGISGSPIAAAVAVVFATAADNSLDIGLIDIL